LQAGLGGGRCDAWSSGAVGKTNYGTTLPVASSKGFPQARSFEKQRLAKKRLRKWVRSRGKGANLEGRTLRQKNLPKLGDVCLRKKEKKLLGGGDDGKKYSREIGQSRHWTEAAAPPENVAWRQGCVRKTLLAASFSAMEGAESMAIITFDNQK